MTPCKFAFLVQVTNTLAVASKRGYNNFVYTCIKTNSTTELNQKLQKARPEDAQNGMFTQGKNTYVSILDQSGGRAFAQRGRIFGKLR